MSLGEVSGKQHGSAMNGHWASTVTQWHQPVIGWNIDERVKHQKTVSDIEGPVIQGRHEISAPFHHVKQSIDFTHRPEKLKAGG
jgi:hypothetical protein